MSMTQTFSITDLAREFQVTTRTIRFYEDQGLLSPRRRGRTRVYGPRDRIRLKLILRGRRLGFPLKQIKEIIELYDAEPGEAGQLRHFLAKISERRGLLERQREDIAITLEELGNVEARCHERLAEMEATRRPGSGNRTAPSRRRLEREARDDDEPLLPFGPAEKTGC